MQLRALSTLFLAALYAVNASAKSCFDDKNLVQLQLDATHGALIYVWSPRMVYSVQNMETARGAADASGLKFVVLHDPRVPGIEMPTLQIASQAMCSQQLIASDALRHFPSALVITQRGVHRHPIVGAMPASAWASSIAQRLTMP